MERWHCATEALSDEEALEGCHNTYNGSSGSRDGCLTLLCRLMIDSTSWIVSRYPSSTVVSIKVGFPM